MLFSDDGGAPAVVELVEHAQGLFVVRPAPRRSRRARAWTLARLLRARAMPRRSPAAAHRSQAAPAPPARPGIRRARGGRSRSCSRLRLRRALAEPGMERHRLPGYPPRGSQIALPVQGTGGPVQGAAPLGVRFRSQPGHHLGRPEGPDRARELGLARRLPAGVEQGKGDFDRCERRVVEQSAAVGLGRGEEPRRQHLRVRRLGRRGRRTGERPDDEEDREHVGCAGHGLCPEVIPQILPPSR